MSLNTVEAARGRWRGILEVLGVNPDFLKDKHGPCPLCGGKDRFRFDDKLNGKWICAQCGYGDGFTLLEKLHGWDFKHAAAEVDRVVGNCPKDPPKPERTEEDKRAYMRQLWRESQPVTKGDPVWCYLMRRCGDPSGAIQDLRYHPSLKHSMDGVHYPAMLAMMGWDGKRYSGIHRTYLTLEGTKAAVDPVRMSFGDLGPVRLGNIVDAVGIAEGIETALCASKIFGLPVWAGICAHGLQIWEPPQGVHSVAIFGDNDANYTGQAAAYALARRLSIAGLSVEIQIPETPGMDWANVAGFDSVLERAS